MCLRFLPFTVKHFQHISYPDFYRDGAKRVQCGRICQPTSRNSLRSALVGKKYGRFSVSVFLAGVDGVRAWRQRGLIQDAVRSQADSRRPWERLRTGRTSSGTGVVWRCRLDSGAWQQELVQGVFSGLLRRARARSAAFSRLSGKATSTRVPRAMSWRYPRKSGEKRTA